jgi:hypothetical protein
MRKAAEQSAGVKAILLDDVPEIEDSVEATTLSDPPECSGREPPEPRESVQSR